LGFVSLNPTYILSVRFRNAKPNNGRSWNPAQFIECAVALKAGYVISGDNALRAIQDYMGIKIVNPKEFLIRNNQSTIQRINPSNSQPINE
jgi:predicted nucleic acid-binding protein